MAKVDTRKFRTVDRDNTWDSLPTNMTLKQAAKFLNLAQLTLRKMVVAGEIPAFRLGPKAQWRVPKEALRKIVEKSMERGKENE